jgi:prepilin-type N-terminal cleavage/methylation domain-containing protein
MPTSAERHSERGFTLLEVMVAVGLLGFVILPILQVRQVSSRKAYNASHLVIALSHAKQLLADYTLDWREIENLQGEIEEPTGNQRVTQAVYTYLITMKEYDLATGLNVYDDELDDDVFSDYEQGLLPGDAGRPPEDEDEERGNPHRVRRYEITMFWPSWHADESGDDEDDALDQLIIEGFLPRVYEEEEEDDDEEQEV